MKTVARATFQDAIDAGIRAAGDNMPADKAEALREHGRTALVTVVGDFYDTEGNCCPASQVQPNSTKVATFPGSMTFATAYDTAMRAAVGKGTIRIEGPSREQLDARRRWAEALERTQRGQTQGALAEGSKRCCLGLLCDLAVVEGIIEDYTPTDGMPPREVMKWVGMRQFNAPHPDDPFAYERSPNACTTYSTMNDNEGKTFKDIAAFIRKNL